MKAAAILLTLLLALAACGQRGPLHFAEPETTPANNQTADTQQRDDERD